MRRSLATVIVSAAAATVLGSEVTARASVIAYEGFTAGSGSVTGQSASDGYGWNGGWSLTPSSSSNNSQDGTINSPGASGGVASPPAWSSPNPNEPVTGYAGLITGSTVVATATNNGNVYRSLSASAISAIQTAMTNDQTIFFSFLIQRQDTNSRAVYAELLEGGPPTSSGGGVDESLLIGGKGGGTNANNWALAAGGNTGGGALKASGTSSETEATTLLVEEISYGGIDGASSTVSMFINPTGTTAPGSADVTLTSVNMSAGPIDTVLLFAGGKQTSSSFATSADFGEMQIGTSFSDVVPEPSSFLALSGVPAAGLLARRRLRVSIS